MGIFFVIFLLSYRGWKMISNASQRSLGISLDNFLKSEVKFWAGAEAEKATQKWQLHEHRLRKETSEQQGQQLDGTEEIKIYPNPEKRFGIRWLHLWQNVRET